MATLPMIPDWQQLHPLIVHFPIALLMVAPLFMLIGILRPSASSAPFLLSALFLMAMGTMASYFAVQTGLAARSQTHVTQEIRETLQRHETLAETTSVTFSALTIIFAGIVLIPRLLSRQPSRVITTTLPAVFLVLYAAGAVLLVDTAHEGGCLVHQFGITAAQIPETHAHVTLRHR